MDLDDVRCIYYHYYLYVKMCKQDWHYKDDLHNVTIIIVENGIANLGSNLWQNYLLFTSC